MAESNFKKTVLSSLLWKGMQTGAVYGIQLIVQILLARLLLPSDYGIIALIIVFITISQCFVNSGLNTALIQKKEIDDTDTSSVFYVSLLIAAVFYTILFLTAPAISAFYNEPLITPVLRVLGLTLFFGAVNSIQNAVIARNFQFKKLFGCSIISTTASGVIGISMAFLGYGVWALAGQQLSAIIASCIIMGFVVKWRPKLLFSIKKVKGLFSFGWKLLVSGMIDIVYNNLSVLIVGKAFSTTMLGYYSKGNEYPNYIANGINGTIQAVMLPAYAKHQDDKYTVKQIMRRALKTSSFVVFPAMALLAAAAEPLVTLLLTDKWLMCVPFLQIFCCVYALWPIHTVNLQAINGIGRSDVFLKLEIVKKIIGVTILIITIPIGIYAIAIGMIFTGVIGTFINAYPNKKLLDYSFLQQWKDLMPALLISLIMAGVVYSVLFLELSDIMSLLIQIPLGILVYFGLARLFKLESFTYITDTLKEYLPKKNKSN